MHCCILAAPSAHSVIMFGAAGLFFLSFMINYHSVLCLLYHSVLLLALEDCGSLTLGRLDSAVKASPAIPALIVAVMSGACPLRCCWRVL